MTRARPRLFDEQDCPCIRRFRETGEWSKEGKCARHSRHSRLTHIPGGPAAAVPLTERESGSLAQSGASGGHSRNPLWQISLLRLHCPSPSYPRSHSPSCIVPPFHIRFADSTRRWTVSRAIDIHEITTFSDAPTRSLQHRHRPTRLDRESPVHPFLSERRAHRTDLLPDDDVIGRRSRHCASTSICIDHTVCPFC